MLPDIGTPARLFKFGAMPPPRRRDAATPRPALPALLYHRTPGGSPIDKAQCMAMDAQLLQDIVDLAPIGMYVVDADFRLRLANPLARSVFGGRDWIGADFGELIHTIWPDPYAGYLLERFRQTLASGEPYEHGSHSEQRRDRGAVEHYKWRIHRTLLDGRPAVICYFRDITERVLAFREV